MTNKHNNWERIQQLLDWTGLTAHAFAKALNLGRTENLYHIKRGSYGISLELCDRICAAYPDIDPVWLLSGVGSMFRNDANNGVTMPYYRGEAEQLLPNIEELEPCAEVHIPYVTGYDFVIKSRSRDMCDKNCAATELFLKSVEVEDIVQGNEYLLIVDGKPIWRRVRLATDRRQWRLVARNRLEYEDIFIEQSQVTHAWRVIARLAILTS